MNTYQIFKTKDRGLQLKLNILGLFCFMSIDLQAQCLYSPVIATNYIVSDCGDKKMQHLMGIALPVYGNFGNLYCTSPLTASVTISALEDFTNETLRIYPNPTFNDVTIDWPYEDEATVYILSTLGQSISYSLIGPFSKNTIEIQHLLPGYYIVKVVNKNNKTYLTKLIKQ